MMEQKCFSLAIDKKVFEYALSVAYDVSSATKTEEYSVSAKETALNAVAFNPDGTKMFITGSSYKIHQYGLQVLIYRQQ